MTVRWWSAGRLARIGITAQLLALIRMLSEVFRLKYFSPDGYTLPSIEPFVGAALFTSVLVSVGVAAFGVGRHRLVLAIAVTNVVALFVYKVAFM